MKKLLIVGGLLAALASAPARAQAPVPAEVLAERKDDIALGRPGAPVTLIAYLEYYYVYPDTVGPLLRQIRRSWPDEVRILVRDFPMAYHQGAALTAQAAHGVFELAGAEAFLQFAETVTPYRGSRDASYLAAVAARVGAGAAERFEEELIRGRWQERVARSQKDVELAHLTGSPQWLVNGTRIVGVLRPPLLAAIEQAVRAAKPGSRPATPSADAASAPPVLRPGQGIGPFQLGQRVEELERTGLRHTPLDAAGWTSVAEPGSDVVAYRLRFVSGALALIDYSVSRTAAGLQVGGALFRRDQPALHKALHGALKCEAIEHLEGGSQAACPSPPGAGVTWLRGGRELACSPWVSLAPSRPCTDKDVAKESTEVRVARD
ncbi:MAG: thioredoxin domain-containing protein [Polyangia bacterium]